MRKKEKKPPYNIRRVNEPGWQQDIAEALHAPPANMLSRCHVLGGPQDSIEQNLNEY